MDLFRRKEATLERMPDWQRGDVKLYLGDCREVMANLPDGSVDAVVCDPPYELGFMDHAWDKSGIAYDVAVWRECLRLLKPGGHLLAFGGTRTYHRMACAIEDSGFEIRDQIQWIHGQGFPKNRDVSKAIDKAAGAARKRIQPGNQPAYQRSIGNTRPWMDDSEHTIDGPDAVTDDAKKWAGFGTALKPAHEPIVVARKPFKGTVAANVLEHGCGALNIGECRIDGEKPQTTRGAGGKNGRYGPLGAQGRIVDDGKGRWPANVIHDGSDEVLAAFPEVHLAGNRPRVRSASRSVCHGGYGYGSIATVPPGDGGLAFANAARFFYCAKASTEERDRGLEGEELHDSQVTRMSGDGMKVRQDGTERKMPTARNTHPTVKPVALMEYLCKLVTQPGGIVLDPFLGSGTTGLAAVRGGFQFIGIELLDKWLQIASKRITAEFDRHPLFDA